MVTGTKIKVKKPFKFSWRQFQLQSMIWPGIIALFIFEYLTMYGVIIAFKKYNLFLGPFKSPWVGLKYFKEMFMDEYIFLALRNTLGINILELIFSFPAPIIFALLLNELTNVKFKKLTQTISYLPHFVSWVIYGGLVIAILSPDNGILNNILVKIGILDKPIAFMARPQYFWVIVLISSIIKNIGWGSIIYLAAISSINQEMYDAALVDGAGRVDRMRYITIPSIITTIMIMLIFQISGMIKTGFDRIWILQNGLNVSASEVFETYTYKLGIVNLQFSYSTAVGLVKSIVSIILLVSANAASRKITEESLF